MAGSGTYSLFPLLPVSLLLLLIFGEGSAPHAGAGDRDTLLAIKKSWNNPKQLASWDPTHTANHCNWTGVTCAGGGSGVVTELVLPGLNLSGSVPASVCTLKNLTSLNLAINNLTGAFPTAALYACAGLRFLSLYNNNFSGALPTDIDGLSPAMEHLDLSRNSFGGEVPQAVARLSALKYLILDNNCFTGTYPVSEISALADLEVLSLGSNPFTPGLVPLAFAKLTKLSNLGMFNMSLTGEIPEALASLAELMVLDMSSNKLTGPTAWVLQHGRLKYVYLFDNGLSGELTRNVTAVNLVQLDLSRNQLIGEIPESFGNLKNLTLMYLYKNQLTGRIPASIALLPQLSYIWLFSNQLSGELPLELGKHSPLRDLDVSSNNLSGPLRATLGTMGELHIINVFNNSFSSLLSY